MKNWAGIFFVWLGTSLVALNQPFCIISEVNKTIRCCFFIVQTSDRIYAICLFVCLFFFCPILLIYSAFFYKTNSTHSIFRTIEALASLPQQIMKIRTT